MEDVTLDNCKDIIYDMNCKLLDIGNKISKMTTHDLDWHQYMDIIPGKNTILSLSNSDLFHNIQEYVNAYIAPYHIQLESEQTWPLEPLVSYM